MMMIIYHDLLPWVTMIYQLKKCDFPVGWLLWFGTSWYRWWRFGLPNLFCPAWFFSCYLALFPKCLDYTRIILYPSKSHGSYESYPIETWYIFTFFFKLPYTRPFSHHIRCFTVATQKCQVSSADRFHGWPWVGVCLLPGQCVLAAEVNWAVFTVENSWENRTKDPETPQ
jgi:hypothetical protein